MMVLGLGLDAREQLSRVVAVSPIEWLTMHAAKVGRRLCIVKRVGCA